MFYFLCSIYSFGCSGSVFLPSMSAVGLVPMETVTRWQRTFLCDCDGMGSLQWHLGNIAVRINHTNAHQFDHTSFVTAASFSISWPRNHIRRTRFSVWKFENSDLIHNACNQRHPVRDARITNGKSTQSILEQHLTQNAQLVKTAIKSILVVLQLSHSILEIYIKKIK